MIQYGLYVPVPQLLHHAAGRPRWGQKVGHDDVRVKYGVAYRQQQRRPLRAAAISRLICFKDMFAAPPRAAASRTRLKASRLRASRMD